MMVGHDGVLILRPPCSLMAFSSSLANVHAACDKTVSSKTCLPYGWPLPSENDILVLERTSRLEAVRCSARVFCIIDGPGSVGALRPNNHAHGCALARHR